MRLPLHLPTKRPLKKHDVFGILAPNVILSNCCKQKYFWHSVENSKPNATMTDRSQLNIMDSIKELWRGLGLPDHALDAVRLQGEGKGLPSSFKIGQLAQASITTTALLAALIYSKRNNTAIPTVTVPLQHAVVEFKSERCYSVDGKPTPSAWGPIGGLHKTSDGYVRLHDGFPNHRDGARRLLGCSEDADRASVASKIASWTSISLEDAAFNSNLVISALRSYEEWDVLPQAKAIKDFPIQIRKIADGPPGLPRRIAAGGTDKCLRGLRVLEMSRVIAAPLAGKTLAAHGADVLWITSPNLPDLPAIDRDFARGKRTAHLEMNNPSDHGKLLDLLDDADVFLQGYRPGSLAARGLSPKAIAARHADGIICASMSAYGPDGPWSHRRGFDSLVQTCSGMNVSEAQHYDKGEPAMPTPCQALDHAGGYFLAAGIIAALYRQAMEGGSFQVDVSLAGVMKYLRSMGQYPGDSGFRGVKDFQSIRDVPEEFLEERKSGFGVLKAVKHSARVDGVQVGWDIMPKPLGSDEPIWL